jgi:hypothetical protein
MDNYLQHVQIFITKNGTIPVESILEFHPALLLEASRLPVRRTNDSESSHNGEISGLSLLIALPYRKEQAEYIRN